MSVHVQMRMRKHLFFCFLEVCTARTACRYMLLNRIFIHLHITEAMHARRCTQKHLFTHFGGQLTFSASQFFSLLPFTLLPRILQTEEPNWAFLRSTFLHKLGSRFQRLVVLEAPKVAACMRSKTGTRTSD